MSDRWRNVVISILSYGFLFLLILTVLYVTSRYGSQWKGGGAMRPPTQ